MKRVVLLGGIASRRLRAVPVHAAVDEAGIGRPAGTVPVPASASSSCASALRR